MQGRRKGRDRKFEKTKSNLFPFHHHPLAPGRGRVGSICPFFTVSTAKDAIPATSPKPRLFLPPSCTPIATSVQSLASYLWALAFPSCGFSHSHLLSLFIYFSLVNFHHLSPWLRKASMPYHQIEVQPWASQSDTSTSGSNLPFKSTVVLDTTWCLIPNKHLLDGWMDGWMKWNGGINVRTVF